MSHLSNNFTFENLIKELNECVILAKTDKEQAKLLAEHLDEHFIELLTNSNISDTELECVKKKFEELSVILKL